MNKTPSILVDTGFEVDQNGALTEIVTPNVVATLDAPRKITFNGTTLNYIPSTAAALQEFEAPNVTVINDNMFKSYTGLVSVNLQSLLVLNNHGTTPTGVFYGCTSLQTVTLPSVTTISCIANLQTTVAPFWDCTSLTTVNLPSLASIDLTCIYNSSTFAGVFWGCTSLLSVTLPKLSIINNTRINGTTGTFYNCTSLKTVTLPQLSTCNDSGSNSSTFGNCTALETVQLGSEGYPVTSLGQYMFKNCTQSNLTITIYTADGNALANSPFGATNATIIWEEA